MSAPIVLATRSAGKLRELAGLCSEAGITVVDLLAAGCVEDVIAEEAIEAHETFEANACAKAQYFFARLGRPVIADDSGLEVTALAGKPGVWSKRWSQRPDLSGVALDDANNATLLQALAGASDRSARYVCVAAFCDAQGLLVARGETPGDILAAPSGSSGFGYDPYFWSTELGRSFGEATLAEKSAVSHRGRAMRGLLREIANRR